MFLLSPSYKSISFIEEDDVIMNCKNDGDVLNIFQTTNSLSGVSYPLHECEYDALVV